MNFDIKKNYPLLIFVGVLILITILLLNSNKNNNPILSGKEESVKIVKNYSNFYTVNSCVYRYLTYLKDENTSSLMKVIDKEFKKKYNINSSNILSYLNSYSGNISFNSKKMYEEKLSDSITKYYVYGYVEEDIMDSYPKQTEEYFIVKLDSQQQVFTIMPYDGQIFK